MSLRVQNFPRSEYDLEQQYDWYLEQAGLDVAKRYLTAFEATVAALALHPGLGRLRRFRSSNSAGIRSYPLRPPFDKHLVFYRANLTTLSIIRVMHGARDLPRRPLE